MPANLKHSWPRAQIPIMTSSSTVLAIYSPLTHCKSDLLHLTPRYAAPLLWSWHSWAKFVFWSRGACAAKRDIWVRTAKFNNTQHNHIPSSLRSPLWPKYFTFCCGGYKIRLLKAKIGLQVHVSTTLWSLYKVDWMVRAVGCRLSGIPLTANFTLVALLQESTVQRLFRIECNTT